MQANLAHVRDIDRCRPRSYAHVFAINFWNFSLSFRREALCYLEVAFLAARTLPTRRLVPPTGVLLDDLLLVCGTAPLLQADLRASPRLELFATDVSSSGAGSCVACVTDDLWRAFHNLAEEQGERVRLCWGSSPPPLELTPSRCACAALISPADWSVLFDYQFCAPDHINVIELTVG